METERIRLRPFRDSDKETLYEYVNDPDVAYNTGWAQVPEQDRNTLCGYLMNDHTWVIELKETGEAIGCVHHDQYGPNQREVGFWIGRPYWNQGFCTEALRLLVDYCFHEIGVTTLWGGCYLENQASARVMEKCGFKEEKKGEGPGGNPSRIMKLQM